MAYRDRVPALEAKLRAQESARRALEASIAETSQELEWARLTEHAVRASARSRSTRRWWRPLLAIAIGALVASGCGLAVLLSCTGGCDGPSRERATHDQASTLVAATEMYLAFVAPVAPGDCPDVAALIEEDIITPGVGNGDAWGTPFRIECADEFPRVTSAGADHEFGTDDDIISR